MSFKNAVIQDGPSKYVLPKMKDMHCDVTAFLSPALFAQTDERLWADAYRSACYPGARGMYLEPDCHVGYVLPVGGVLVTDDTIVQAGSGFDINCGVLAMRTTLHAGDVVDWEKRKLWVHEVERHVATGVGSHQAETQKTPNSHKVGEILRHGAKAIGVHADICERHYIPVSDDYDEFMIREAYDKAAPQLGSVGGGNHYVEMDVDDKDGSVWLFVHCGSRGYGWRTADYFFKRGAELRGLPNNRREESWLRVDEPLGKQYWDHHNAAANYAIANRHTIVYGVQRATEDVFGVTPEVYFEIAHNLVQQETLVLPDGTTTRGFVHRKGATRAFPAGHPDLRNTRWFDTGHPCLIPGSMFHGAAILFPLEGAYQSGCSVNHGSGRQLGRGEAKRQLAEVQSLIDEEMRTVKRTFDGVEVTGIVGNTEKTPLDESHLCYKNLDEVLAVLTDNRIARLDRRLYPVANLKGAD